MKKRTAGNHRRRAIYHQLMKDKGKVIMLGDGSVKIAELNSIPKVSGMRAAVQVVLDLLSGALAGFWCKIKNRKVVKK